MYLQRRYIVIRIFAMLFSKHYALGRMKKTQKELAFLRDLYIEDAWTHRFTDLVDKHLKIDEAENLLYLNAGTGGHAFALSEKFGEKTDLFAACENDDILSIARDKAAAVSSNVDFSCIRFEDDAFDAVLADATFVRPAELADFIDDAVRVARNGADVALFLPAAGSYGEVFSVLWEVLFNEELPDDNSAVERLVAAIPTISRVEEIAERAGLVNIKTETAIEIFEYENGAEFVASPLVEDFLMPIWLETLGEDELVRITAKIAQLIDSEEGDLTFRFTVKAILVTGEKA